MTDESSSKVSAIARAARRLYPKFVEAYCTVDPRSLGLGRIGLGLLLLHDLARRVPGLATWYSNEGLLPNHTVLWRPSSDYVFSFLLAASRPEEVALLFAVFAFIFAAFTVGWHTRFFHVLSFVCLVSLHDRVIFLENGGDVALNLLCAWTLFLPMGRRFSIDALRKASAAGHASVAGELEPAPKDTRPVASIAVLAILLELSVIYYFNAVNKHGWTWRRGLAVYYVLYQERMITWFGLLLRSIMTVPLSRVLSYAVLAIEYAAPILLLVPFQRVRLRRIAMVVFPALHLAFAAGLNLGQFSFNMIGYFPLLLSADDWSVLGRRFAPLRSWFASSERWIARVLGLGRSSAPPSEEIEAIPARGWLLRRAAEMRELAAFVLLFAVTWQLFVENHAIPQRYKVPQPKWIAGLVVYPRLLQGWQMFSADVPTGERMLYVDAATFGGRHVDPFNEAGSSVSNLPVDTIPRHMQQDEFWCDYTNRIPENEAYWRAFKEWIFGYHLRTGRPEDRIISFEAHLLEHDEPAPGETGPKNVRTRVIMREHE